MNTPATPEEMDDTNDGVVTANSIGAAISQSTRDALAAKGIVSALAVVENTQTGWDGLTKGQEAVQAELAERARIEQEYRELIAELDENDRQYDRILSELSARRDQIKLDIDALKANAIVMPDGRRAYPDGHGGFVYLDDDGNATALKGAEVNTAQKLYDASGHTNTQAQDLQKKIQDYKTIDSQIDAVKAAKAHNQELRQQLQQGTLSGSDAQAAVSQATQQRIDAVDDAKTALDATKSVVSASQVKAVEATRVDDDYFSMADNTGNEPDTPSTAVSTTRNTSVAGQQLGSPSDLSSKGPFAAASAPVSVAVVPAVVQENHGSTQRTPVTPSPGAAV